MTGAFSHGDMGLWPKFDLTKIKEITGDNSPDYYLLSQTTVMMALDGLTRFPEMRTVWVSNKQSVTDLEWDEITAMVDRAKDELMEVLMVGTILPFAGSIPPGFLLCDGAAVSREIYSLLFEEIGIVYGPGDGSTTFNLPDLQGRGIAGQDAGQAEFADLGQSGGEKAHTLTTDEIPAHSHSETTAMATLINGGIEAPAPAALPGWGNTGSTGGGGSHNNLQPYLVLQFGIKC